MNLTAEKYAKELRFGREALAERYATLLTKCDPSVMVGLLAPWGSGKTSLVKRVETILSMADKPAPGNQETIGKAVATNATKTSTCCPFNDQAIKAIKGQNVNTAHDSTVNSIECLFFSAWDHENPNGLVSAMMTELAHKFKKDAEVKDALIEAAGAIGGLVAGLAIRSKSFNMVGFSDVLNGIGKLKKDAEAGVRAASVLQEKLLNEYLHNEHNKLKTNLEKAVEALGEKGTTRIGLLIDETL